MKPNYAQLALALTIAHAPLFAVAANAKARPNILFLFTDDQRNGTIHAQGNAEIVTPNMDALVRAGTAFRQAHIMGSTSGAVCQPSRAMLMTGRTLFHLEGTGARIPASTKTFPEVFRENGYVTFETGKWHSDKISFNRSFEQGANIFMGGMHMPSQGGHWTPRLHTEYDPTGAYNKTTPGKHFSSVCYADAAISFLEKRKTAPEPTQRPFLMYVAFTSPHDPRTPPPYGHAYKPDDITLPPNFKPRHPFDNGELNIRDELLLPHPRTPEAVRGEIAKYYGMISEVDYQIGRVIAALKASGEYDNTIIVFSADNGLAVGQHGLLGKQSLYDHSIRVPLVICGPGIPKNAENQAYCYLLDLFPTLCDLADVTPPKTVEGISLKKVLFDNTQTVRDHLFFSYMGMHQRALKKDGWKLIEYELNGVRHTQLFDLNTDPWELKDRSVDANCQDKLKTLNALLQKDWRLSDPPPAKPPAKKSNGKKTAPNAKQPAQVE